MDLYATIKTLHILSSTILFGTGIGIAFFMLRSWFTTNIHEKLYAARNTVLADYLFTFPAVVIQPISGIALIHMAGFDWTGLWLMVTYAIYVIAGLCWLACFRWIGCYILSYGDKTYMNTLKEKSGVWFVYDGQCPICTHAAKVLRIKQDYGEIHTLNAREFNTDPLIEEINRRGLDLDEGMVIYAGKDKSGNNKTINFELTAQNGDGSYIPCMPAILIAKKLAYGHLKTTGAKACIGMISKQEYLEALENLAISWAET